MIPAGIWEDERGLVRIGLGNGEAGQGWIRFRDVGKDWVMRVWNM